MEWSARALAFLVAPLTAFADLKAVGTPAAAGQTWLLDLAACSPRPADSAAGRSSRVQETD